MATLLTPQPEPAAQQRLQRIAQARQHLLGGRGSVGLGASSLDGASLVAPWIERSWRRCLDNGQEPQHAVVFDAVSAAAAERHRDADHRLVSAARPVLEQLGTALAHTGYFAILANARGVVVDAYGPVDTSDRRVHLITRIGVDLSESRVGTTAIGAALGELQPVWLHRGEHFFHDTSCYSCAGAPLFGPWGECVGMLDLTGVDTPERPELLHLATMAARRIENALALLQPAALWLRLNWPGMVLGTESDGLLGLDREGYVCSSNAAARAMLPALAQSLALAMPRSHASELFALSVDTLFDAAHRPPAPLDAPLWSGLHLQLQALPGAWGRGLQPGRSIAAEPGGTAPARRLRDIETALIRKAVDEARGNVVLAAQRLGVSRATVYRKLRGPRS